MRKDLTTGAAERFLYALCGQVVTEAGSAVLCQVMAQHSKATRGYCKTCESVHVAF